MNFPIFPNVPDLPGVPALPRFKAAGAQLASIRGAISDNVLSVSQVMSGTLYAGSNLSGSGLINGTGILNQLTGTVGGVGTYAVNLAQSFTGNMSSVFTPFSDSGGDVLTSDAPGLSQSASAPQWGIFKDGKSVVRADNVLGVELKKEWLLSDFPLEAGAFETYDKVTTPYDIRVRFSRGGSVQDRQDFLDSIDDISGNLEKYDVYTPEETYIGVNVTHYDYQRTAGDGLGLIKVEVWLEQVRETATQTFSNTKVASSQDSVNGGTKQTSAPTPTETAAVKGGLH